MNLSRRKTEGDLGVSELRKQRRNAIEHKGADDEQRARPNDNKLTDPWRIRLSKSKIKTTEQVRINKNIALEQAKRRRGQRTTSRHVESGQPQHAHRPSSAIKHN